jgi:peptidoglycan hydrolase CwlO-like protein
MKENRLIEKVSEKITEAVGTPASVIIHTVCFAGIFSLVLFGLTPSQVLLALTTVLSIEAIYLALFIQMTVNKTSESIEDVEEDIEDIQEDAREDDAYDAEVAKALQSIESEINHLKEVINHQKESD